MYRAYLLYSLHSEIEVLGLMGFATLLLPLDCPGLFLLYAIQSYPRIRIKFKTLAVAKKITQIKIHGMETHP